MARSVSIAYDCDEPTLEVVGGFLAQFAGPDQEELRGEAYCGPVTLSETAPLLDRTIALNGRDPAWSPA